MIKKTYPIIVFFILAAILLAGVFYWQKTQNITQSDLTKNKQTQTETATLPKFTEQEIATTTPPFEIKGEISRGNPNKKQIIFTFDAGSGNNSLEKILSVTQNHGVTPTFFVTGKFAEKYPESVKQMAASGAEVFNHTYDHPYLTKITDEQIKKEFAKTEQIISELTGKTTKPFFRPPYGDRNKHVFEIAQSEGYQSVYWTLDALDWETDKTADEVKQRIYNKASNGAIILMHIGDNITGNILDEVFTKIENEGYKIVSLTEGIK